MAITKAKRARVPWDDYFLKIASAVSDRSTCDRLQVGCVLVRENIILSTGYNGSVRGLPHCDEVGKPAHAAVVTGGKDDVLAHQDAAHLKPVTGGTVGDRGGDL